MMYTLFQNEIVDAWKDINQEFLKPTAVTLYDNLPLLERVLINTSLRGYYMYFNSLFVMH